MGERIQRRRTKGYRLPEGAVYVGRGTRWGNPWRVEPFMGGWSVDAPEGHIGVWEDEASARRGAVDAYRHELLNWNHDFLMRWLDPLRGRDLACWCKPDAEWCHADVLLELANG